MQSFELMQSSLPCSWFCCFFCRIFSSYICSRSTQLCSLTSPWKHLRRFLNDSFHEHNIRKGPPQKINLWTRTTSGNHHLQAPPPVFRSFSFCHHSFSPLFTCSIVSVLLPFHFVYLSFVLLAVFLVSLYHDCLSLSLLYPTVSLILFYRFCRFSLSCFHCLSFSSLSRYLSLSLFVFFSFFIDFLLAVFL